jgi:hypothetical protein
VLPEGVLFGRVQGFASPVPPFAGEVERFPDEPGARPLIQVDRRCLVGR